MKKKPVDNFSNETNFEQMKKNFLPQTNHNRLLSVIKLTQQSI